ncbi:MAG TPA: prolipoprotein diacylglyceryl transferase [Verrucomicrobiae bacterium]|nr:prolipoprotein diacylglyceryl transferase [Verrucomicrobiae bacterium]
MHSIAFHLGGLTIHWYGILVAMGFLAGLWTASRRARLVGISPEQIYDLGPWLIIGGILGGRTLYVISYWHEQFAEHPFPEIFMVQHGGLVYYGGLIGGALATMAYLHWKKLPVWKMADVLAPSIALGCVFGRIGCLLNGCCYGRQCNLPWAIHFPLTHETHGVGVHPTEIYDSLLNLGFYVFLAWLFRRRKFDGHVFAVYLIGYAILRSFVEYFRGDYPVYYLGGWATPAQLVSMGIIVGGLLLLFLLPRPRAVAEAK